MGSVRGEGSRKKFVADDLGKRRSKNCDRTREYDPRPVISLPYGLKQITGTVYIDAVSLIKIRFCFTGHDGRSMQNDFRMVSHQLFTNSRSSQVARHRSNGKRTLQNWRRCDDIHHRQTLHSSPRNFAPSRKLLAKFPSQQPSATTPT